jgi:uncharacterized protein YndB with AHSA1/START domain
MPIVHRELRIDAPPERVFQQILNLRRMPEWWTSISEIRTTREIAELGHRYEWTYKMMGLSFEGTGEVLEVTPPSRYVVRNEGIPSTITHELCQDGGGTRYTLTVDYVIPAKFGGRLTGKLFLERHNEKDADQIVANLKRFCERPS